MSHSEIPAVRDDLALNEALDRLVRLAQPPQLKARLAQWANAINACGFKPGGFSRQALSGVHVLARLSGLPTPPAQPFPTLWRPLGEGVMHHAPAESSSPTAEPVSVIAESRKQAAIMPMPEAQPRAPARHIYAANDLSPKVRADILASLHTAFPRVTVGNGAFTERPTLPDTGKSGLNGHAVHEAMHRAAPQPGHPFTAHSARIVAPVKPAGSTPVPPVLHPVKICHLTADTFYPRHRTDNPGAVPQAAALAAITLPLFHRLPDLPGRAPLAAACRHLPENRAAHLFASPAREGDNVQRALSEGLVLHGERALGETRAFDVACTVGGDRTFSTVNVSALRTLIRSGDTRLNTVVQPGLAVSQNTLLTMVSPPGPLLAVETGTWRPLFSPLPERPGSGLAEKFQAPSLPAPLSTLNARKQAVPGPALKIGNLSQTLSPTETTGPASSALPKGNTATPRVSVSNVTEAASLVHFAPLTAGNRVTNDNRTFTQNIQITLPEGQYVTAQDLQQQFNALMAQQANQVFLHDIYRY